MPVKTPYYPVLIGVLHPNIGAMLSGYVTRKNLKPWYESLKKPSWTPPKWAFGPVWTSLYCSMGYASYLVWRDGGGLEGAPLPLAIYASNLILNWSWAPIFFGAHNIKLALYEISLLWVSTAATCFSFYKVNPVAGGLILPYLAWTSVATALNYVIYRDNCSAAAVAEEKKD